MAPESRGLPRPLRRIERLVAALTAPSPHADAILGDLREGFARRVELSPRDARRWYRRQAASLAWHYLPALPAHAWRAWRAWRAARRARPTPGDPAVTSLGSDLRHAVRALRRRPAVTAVLLLTLALGVGANAAIFGVVRGVLLRPLPFPDPDGVVTVWTNNLSRGWLHGQASRQDAADWAAETGTFAALGTYSEMEANAAVGTESERVRVALADAATFVALGVPAHLGRVLGRADDAAGAPPVAVVSHAFWSRALGADPAALGRAIVVDGKPLTVVGVMPPGFDFPAAATAIWRPFGEPAVATGSRGARWVNVVGRLRPGVTPEAAQARMATVAARLASAYPQSNRGFGVTVEPRLRAQTGDVRPLLLVAWGMVALVLAIVGTNGASLLLARAAEREGEVAVRAALGARRRTLARQMLAESVLLALLGGVLGAALGALALPPLRRMAEDAGIPRAASLALDGWVLLYSVAVSLAIGVAFGLAPALGAARTHPADALRRAGRGGAAARARVRGALTVAQVALATVVLVAAGLLLRSFDRVSRVEPGVALDGRVTFRVAPDWGTYRERVRAEALYADLLARLTATPGVTAAAAVNRLPLTGQWWWTSFEPEGKPAEPGREPMGGYRVVTPGYFAAAGIPLLRGRGIEAADREDAPPVTVVSRALAERAWPGEDPLGKRISFDPRAPHAPLYTVVGVAADVHTGGLAEAPEPLGYVSLGQATFGHFRDWGMDVVVHSSLGTDAVVAAARRALRAVAPSVPPFEARPLADLVARDLARRRLLARLLGAFAATAVVLAGFGLYGVVAYSVARRRGELGVRMALGARGAVVGRAVVARSVALALAGLAIGLPAAAAAARVLASLLYDTAPRDPLTFVAVGAALLVVAGVAAWVPARRASRVDPAIALRAE